MLKLRETELKPLIFCLQSAVEFYGLEKAVELAKATLKKYAEDRFVKMYNDLPMDKRWEFFRSNLLKMADNISFSIDEHNENMIKIKYVWRSFLEIFKKYGLEEFVPQYCNTDYDTCQKIHPGIKMTRTRTLVESEFCDHCREYAPK